MIKQQFLLLIIPFFCLSQNSFYLGFGSVTTLAKIKNSENYIEKQNSDFGLYYGNNISISNNFITTIECFYLNQEVVLGRTVDSRFELHQNIGIGIKPGFYSGNHSIHLSLGVLGVYVFDKSEIGLGQFDHFDESFFIGMDYNYDINNKFSCNFSVILSDFSSNSYFSDRQLKDFTILQFSIHYHILKNLIK